MDLGKGHLFINGKDYGEVVEAKINYRANNEEHAQTLQLPAKPIIAPIIAVGKVELTEHGKSWLKAMIYAFQRLRHLRN